MDIRVCMTCVKRLLIANSKSGLLRQVVSEERE